MADRDAILFKDAIMVHIFRQALWGHRDCCIGLVTWEVSHIVKLQMQRLRSTMPSSSVTSTQLAKHGAEWEEWRIVGNGLQGVKERDSEAYQPISQL